MAQVVATLSHSGLKLTTAQQARTTSAPDGAGNSGEPQGESLGPGETVAVSPGQGKSQPQMIAASQADDVDVCWRTRQSGTRLAVYEGARRCPRLAGSVRADPLYDANGAGEVPLLVERRGWAC